jgi:transcriptional regulator with XRE-family HTH domain
MEITKLKIGERIKIIRNSLGLSQELFGLRLGGLKKSSISAYESGDNYPTPKTLAEIAIMGGLTLDQLITGKEEKAPYQTTPFGNGQLSESSAAHQNGPDLALTKQVIEAVMEHLQSNQLTMPPAKIADLIEVLYEEISESEDKQVNKGTVARMIKLAI